MDNFAMPKTTENEGFGPPKAEILLSDIPLLVLTHTPPRGGGVPWKVIAIRPLRAKLTALSPYVPIYG